MSNFLIFKAAFNNSATPAIGTYTAEGATAQFNLNASISPDYYLYNTADNTAVQWFVPTAEATDFELVADILTRQWSNNVTYFAIADSTGTTRLRMWSKNDNWYFENSDSTATTGDPEYVGVVDPTTSGGFNVFHRFRVRVRKLTASSSSSVEVYVDGTLKLTATAGAALVTCAKIGFVGGVNAFGPGTGAGVKNVYLYDLSSGDVIDRGVLSEAFNRLINWMKSKFALKSDIPTVNNGTLTIRQNGTDVQTFTANASTNATANIQCMDLSTAQTAAGDKTFSGTTTTHDVIPATTDTYDIGSSTKEYNNAYIKALTINGTATGDILTHNASEFVPRSGGAVMTGTFIGRSDALDEIMISGGDERNHGGNILLIGSAQDYNQGAICLIPNKNGQENYMWIHPDGTWTWQGSACVVGSDRRIKDEIESIPDEILDAWENLEPKQYKLKSDLETDKDNAQVHYGWIAQEVESIINGNKKGEIKNGLWLHETWEEQEEVSHEEEYQEEVETKSGETETVTKTRKVIDQPYKAKGDSYGLRYTECLVVECKYLRRCIARLTTRIEELEKGKRGN